MDFVIRAPSATVDPGSDETMRREALVLSSLANTRVPHPRIIGYEPDHAPIGRSFYVMEYVEGVNVVSHPPTADQATVLAESMIDAVVKLHDLDPANLGLTGLGRPGFLQRQTGRWLSQLESYRRYSSYQPGLLPNVGAICQWLDSHRPAAGSTSVIHGDVHIGNVLVDERGRVTALLDWELATLGDPLLDLGQLVATWPDAEGRSRLGPIASPNVAGFPPASTLLERYRQGTSRDLTRMDWYVVLAEFRLAAILEGSYARSLDGWTPVDVGRELHTAAIELLEDAFDRTRQ